MAARDAQVLDDLCRLMEQDPGLPRNNPTASYWQQPPAQLQIPPSLPEDLVDVAVIGSGITGCSVARHLFGNNALLSVVMLEARKATSGATGRNGGHIKATPELSFSSFATSLGDEHAQEIVRFTMKNVQELLALSATLTRDLQQRAEVRRVDAVNIYTTEQGFRAMADKVHNFNAANPDLANRMTSFSNEELAKQFGILNSAGGFVSQAGAAWPYRLVTGVLSDLIQRHGARFQLYEDAPVTSVEYSDGTYHLSTPSGSVRARKVVHASNGYATHLLPGLRGMLFPVRGQMTAQTPNAAFGVQGGQRSWSIHYDNGFDYITQSGRSGEIFAGGGLAFSTLTSEVGSTRDDVNATEPDAHLRTIMNKVFGKQVCENVKATWTGIMGFTADGLPIVGRLPHRATGRDGDEEWIAAGYNGYGMANAWLCGKHIAERMSANADIEPVPKAYLVTESRLQDVSTRTTARELWEAFGSKAI